MWQSTLTDTTCEETSHRIQRRDCRHLQAAIASLENNRRRDVRLRLQQLVTLELSSEDRQMVVIENLSLGGVGLTGAPVFWVRDSSVAFALLHQGERLWVHGRVIWRQQQTVGVAFLRRSPEQDQQVYSSPGLEICVPEEPEALHEELCGASEMWLGNELELDNDLWMGAGDTSQTPVESLGRVLGVRFSW